MGRDSNALPIAKLIEVQQPQGFGAGAQGDTGSQPFPTKQYDVTNSAQLYCNCGVCCGMSQTLTLEAEEVVFRDANCMGESVRRTVYGEISMVDKQTACGCCAAVMTNVFAVSPGCGCETALVDEIVSELKARTRNRGDAGQVQRADKQIAMIQTVDEKVTNLEAKLELLMRHLNVEQPAPGNIERY